MKLGMVAGHSALVKKLLIKPGQRMVILNAPAGYVAGLVPLPEGVELSDTPDGTFDFVQLFVKDFEELHRLAPMAKQAAKRDGLLWICYPKGSSKVKTDLSRDSIWAALRKDGLDGVAMISIDDVWSAMRFRPSDLVGKKKG